MTKLLNFLLGLALLLGLLVAAAVLLIPLLVDPNSFRGEIVDQVKRATGRDLRIEGDIGLSVFPWLGVELGGLSLGQPAGFGTAPFVAVRHAQVRARLLPLLHKRLEVDTLTLTGLRLNLIRNAQGRGNWEDLSQRTAGPAAPAGGTPDQAPVPDSSQGAGLQGLMVGGVQVSDARLSWEDRRQGRQLTLRDLSLETGRLLPGAPVDLQLAFTADNQAPAFSGRVRLTTTLTATDGPRLSLRPFELRLERLRGADGLTAGALIKAAIQLDPAAQTLQVEDLSIEQDLAGGPLGGIKAGSRLTGRLTADLGAQRYRIEDLRLTTRLQGEQLPGESLEARLGAAVTLELPQGRLQVQGLDLQAAGLHLTGDLTGRQLQSAPRLTGRLALAELSPRALLQGLAIPLPAAVDPALLKRFSLSTDLDADPAQVGLRNLKVGLDDSYLSGDVWLLPGARPGYRFTLKLDGLDLDRYLPPGPGRSAPAPQPQQSAATAAEPLLFPVARLRGLDVDGSLSIGHLVVHGLKLEDARLALKAQGGNLTLEQQVGRFYQGRLGGTLGIDVKGQTPRVQVLQRVQGVQAGPLLQDLTGQDRLSGSGDLDLDLSGSGATLGALKRSLDGRLAFAFTDGAIKGVNLGRMLREATARLEGKTPAPDQEADETDFSELRGSAVIRDGVLYNEDLSAKSPLFRLTGAGRLDLGQGTLDYQVKPVLVATLQGQGGEDLNQLKGIPIPVRFKGPLGRPDWSIELAEALTESQKAHLEGRLDAEIRKRVPKEFQDKFPQGLLKGLFH